MRTSEDNTTKASVILSCFESTVQTTDRYKQAFA